MRMDQHSAAMQIGAGWAVASTKRGSLQAGAGGSPAKKPRDGARPASQVEDEVRSAFRAQQSFGVSLRRAFHVMDKDHLGRVTTEQFRSAMDSMGLRLTRSDVDSVWNKLAADDGLVSYERLLQFVELQAPAGWRSKQPPAGGARAGMGASPDAAAAFGPVGSGTEMDAAIRGSFAADAGAAAAAAAAASAEEGRRIIMAAAAAASASAPVAGTWPPVPTDPATVWSDVGSAGASSPDDGDDGEAAAQGAAEDGSAGKRARPRKRPSSGDIGDEPAAPVLTARAAPDAAFPPALGLMMPLGARAHPHDASEPVTTRQGSSDPPSARRPRLDAAEQPAPAARSRVDRPFAMAAAEAAAAGAPPRARKPRANAADARAASASRAFAAASAAPLRPQADAPAGSAAPAARDSSPALRPGSAGSSLSDFTVMAHALAAVAKLSSAGQLSARQVIGAKLAVFDVNAVVRRAVGEFAGTRDEATLLLTMQAIGRAVAGE